MTIAYLYHDLLNLYGESGNVKMILKILKENNIEANLLLLSIEDKLDFSKYDLVYIGSGTEDNLMIALEHLRKYKDDIKTSIANDKAFLITGNALDMFGTKIIDPNSVIPGLNMFDYEVNIGERIIDEVFIDSKVTKNKIIGFTNRASHMSEIENNLFERDGIKFRNFFGTYVLGPLLVRNPEFCEYFLKRILPRVKLKIDLKLEKKAYTIFLNKYCRGVR